MNFLLFFPKVSKLLKVTQSNSNSQKNDLSVCYIKAFSFIWKLLRTNLTEKSWFETLLRFIFLKKSSERV